MGALEEKKAKQVAAEGSAKKREAEKPKFARPARAIPPTQDSDDEAKATAAKSQIIPPAARPKIQIKATRFAEPQDNPAEVEGRAAGQPRSAEDSDQGEGKLQKLNPEQQKAVLKVKDDQEMEDAATSQMKEEGSAAATSVDKGADAATSRMDVDKSGDDDPLAAWFEDEDI